MQEQLSPLDLIAFSTMDSYTVASWQDIICCTAEGGYSRIVMAGRDSILIAKGLTKLEAFLPGQQFVRVHKNAIVNLRHIRLVLKGEENCLLLSNNMKVAVADRRRKELIGRLEVI